MPTDALRTLLDAELPALRRAAMIVTTSPELGDAVLRDGLVAVAHKPRISPDAARRLVLTALFRWSADDELVDAEVGSRDMRTVLLSAMTELDAADRFALAAASEWPDDFTHFAHTDATAAYREATERLSQVLTSRGHLVVGASDALDTEQFRRPD